MGCGGSKQQAMAVNAVRNELRDEPKKKEEEKKPEPAPKPVEEPPKAAEPEPEKPAEPEPEPEKPAEPEEDKAAEAEAAPAAAAEEAEAGDEPKLTVYLNKASGSCLRLMTYLALRGLDYEVEDVDFSKGEHKTDEHRERNPHGELPAIKFGDHFMHETWAIIQFLEENVKKNPLTPSDPKDEAVCLNRAVQAIKGWEDNQANQRVLVFSKEKSIEDEEVQDLLRSYYKELKFWDALLEGKEYLVGDSFTYADALLMPQLAVDHVLGLQPAEHGLPNIGVWYSRISTDDKVAPILSVFLEHVKAYDPPTDVFPKVAELVRAAKDGDDEGEKKDEAAAADEPAADDAEKKDDEAAGDDAEKKDDEAAADDAEKKDDEAAGDDAEKKDDEAAADDAEKKDDEAAADDAEKKDDEAAADDAEKKDDEAAADDAEKKDDEAAAGDEAPAKAEEDAAPAAEE